MQELCSRLYKCTHGTLGDGQLSNGVTSELLVNVDSRASTADALLVPGWSCFWHASVMLACSAALRSATSAVCDAQGDGEIWDHMAAEYANGVRPTHRCILGWWRPPPSFTRMPPTCLHFAVSGRDWAVAADCKPRAALQARS